MTLEAIGSWLAALPPPVLTLGTWLQGAFVATFGLVLASVASRAIGSWGRRGWTPQHVMLGQRTAFWGIVGLFGVSGLETAGFDLSVLLGAAGVFTVALGFASQTSASNVVSGVFILAERPFEVGDVIRLGTTTGTVLSIDMLSVKLRTFDNLYVRVPNETVMKSEIVNVSRFPVRRYDLVLRVEPSADLDLVRTALIGAADGCEAALDEPRPVVIFQGYVDSGIELQLSAWSTQERYLDLRNTLPRAVDQALRDAGIRVGFPRWKLEVG